MSRSFILDRIKDISGISGVGIVAEGAIFSNGKVVLCWTGDVSSISCYDNISSVEKVHCHNGSTVIKYVQAGDNSDRNETDDGLWIINKGDIIHSHNFSNNVISKLIIDDFQSSTGQVFLYGRTLEDLESIEGKSDSISAMVDNRGKFDMSKISTGVVNHFNTCITKLKPSEDERAGMVEYKHWSMSEVKSSNEIIDETSGNSLLANGGFSCCILFRDVCVVRHTYVCNTRKRAMTRAIEYFFSSLIKPKDYSKFI